MNDHWRTELPDETSLTDTPDEEELLYGAASKNKVQLTQSQRLLRRVRNELAIELSVILICFVLALGLNFKITLTLVLMCLKFAVPDFVTAYLVLTHEDSRAHGFALACFFVATGMFRACVGAWICLVIIAILLMTIFAQVLIGPPVATIIETALACANGLALIIFPLTFVGYVTAKLSGIRVYFAFGLTKLRRTSDVKKKNEVAIDVHASLWWLEFFSSSSLALGLIALWEVLWANRMAQPLETFLTSALCYAIWSKFFVRGMLPQTERKK